MEYLWHTLKDDADVEKELWVEDWTLYQVLEEVGDEEVVDEHPEEEEEDVLHGWERTGPGRYVLREDTTDGATTPDHVKEEDRMDFVFPQCWTAAAQDRARLPEHHWLQTRQLQTLLSLLHSEEDFSRIQVLCGLREWVVNGQVKAFQAFPDVMQTLSEVLFQSSTSAVKRLAAKMIAELSTDRVLRAQLVRLQGGKVLEKFFAILTDGRTEHGSMTRGIIANIFANGTGSDVGFTDFIIRNIKVDSLFLSLEESNDWILKANILKLMRNILVHPVGYETLTAVEDYNPGTLIRAVESLVPVFHQTSFEIMDILLRVSRCPHQERIHTRFLKENCVTHLIALLEETCFTDSKVALNVTLLLDHLADGEKGVYFLLCTGFSVLKSILYFGGKPGNKKTVMRGGESRLLTGSFGDIMNHFVQMDKYNALGAVPWDKYELPSVKLGLPTASDELQLRKPTKKEKYQLETIYSRGVRDSAGVRLCQRRVLWEVERSRADPEWRPTPVKYARKCVEAGQEANQTVDRNVKIMVMEVLAKLATHRQGAKVVTDLVRYLCPLLVSFSELGSVCESVGYCLQLILQGSRASLTLLPRYYLVRELARGLELVQSEVAMGALLGALAELLKHSCTSAYCLPNFRIRPAVHYWLRQSPSQTPARTCLSNLIVIYHVARQYKRRDFILSKTVVTNLFRIIQDGNLEEMSRIYAICGLGLLTFGNKRYRKLGNRKYSVEDMEVLKNPLAPDDDTSGSEDDVALAVPGLHRIHFGPYPTLNSFSTVQTDEQLFLQEGSRGTRSPLTFFITFLMNLLLQRSYKFWSPFYLQHHLKMMDWLGECYKEKQPMAQDIYETLMNNIPTLSLYYNNTVNPWAKVDRKDFIVCVDDDVFSTFTQILAEKEELDSIYIRYKLSASETIGTTPWEIYWKDRYSQQRNVSQTPKLYPSVFPDSIFGLGGMYRETADGDEPFVVHSKQIKELIPQNKQTYITYHPQTIQNPKKYKVSSTFYRSQLPTTYKNKYFKTQEEFLNSPKQMILPNLYGYMKQLLEGVPICKVIKSKREFSFKKIYIFKKDKRNNLENKLLVKLYKFYKPRIKLYSKVQFQLLVKSIKSPPILWELFTQKENNDENLPKYEKKFKKLKKRLKYFPNSFLNKVYIPSLFIDKKSGSVLFKRSPYEEAANLLSTLVFDSYETINGKTFPFIQRPGRKTERKEGDLLWSDERRMPVMSVTDLGWYREMGTFGKRLVHLLDRPNNEKMGAFILRYRMPPDIYQRKVSTVSEYSPRRSRKSSLSVWKRNSSRRSDPSSDNQSVATTSTNKLNVQKDGSQILKKQKQQKSITKYSNINHLHVPTLTEVVIDLFFQPSLHEIRGFHYLPQLEEKTAFGSRKSNLSEKNITDQSAIESLSEKDILLLKKDIDYQKFDSGKLVEMQKSSQTSQDSEEQYSVRSSHNPNFAQFCEYVKKGVLNILENVGVQCWYADILKLIAKNVCLRLEGPFGYVDDYLMRHHRQDLKRLLGTSLIPFGRLRIGGQLERAILFKFFADQFMIPCGLQREGLSGAWVEVPRHPFLFPQHGTCIVNLRNKPGDLITEGSQEADEYKGYTAGTKIDQVVLNAYELETLTYQDSLEKIILDIKSKENNIKDRLKSEIMTNYSEDINESCTMDIKSETVLKNENLQQIMNLPECSFVLSKEHFQRNDLNDSESISEEVSQEFIEEEALNTTESENSSALFSNTLVNEDFVHFYWKTDPDGMYSILIGRVSDSSFTRGTPRGSNQTTSRNVERDDDRGFNYIKTTAQQLLQELSEDLSEVVTKPGLHYKSPQKHISPEDKDESKYFEKWKDILKKLLNNESTNSANVTNINVE